MYQEPILYRFRPGVLDHIMRSRNLNTENQLAVFLGVPESYLPKFRAGELVSAKIALKVAALQGDANFINGYFDLVHVPQPAQPAIA